MKILYIHGFNSSGNSRTASVLKRELTEHDVISFDVPADPVSAVKIIRKLIASEGVDMIVGSSLGGFYTNLCGGGAFRIMINPTFIPSVSLGEFVGENEYFSQREDNIQRYEFTQQMLESFKPFERIQFDDITHAELLTTWGVFGVDDNLEHYDVLYKDYYTQTCYFQGGHRLEEKDIIDYIIPLIRKIDRDSDEIRREIERMDHNGLMMDFT